MKRTALATLIGATIALGAFTGLATTSIAEPATAEPATLQTDTRERVTLTLPQVDPEPLPDIRAVAAQQEREAAAEEAAQRAPERTVPAEEQSMSIGDNDVDVDTYCDPSTGMMLDGTPCGNGAGERLPTSGETQYEYGCRQGYITEGC